MHRQHFSPVWMTFFSYDGSCWYFSTTFSSTICRGRNICNTSAKCFFTLRQQEFFTKPSKCIFGKDKVEYSGHVITRKRWRQNLQKSKPCKLGHRVAGVLGPNQLLHVICLKLRLACLLLTNLLKKNNFQRNLEAKQAVEALKQAMSATLVLAFPKFSQTFILQTVASEKGLGPFWTKKDDRLHTWARPLPNRNNLYQLMLKRCLPSWKP